MVVAANNVGDLHRDVVDDHAKIVGRRAVRAGDDQVVELAVIKNDVALNQILDHGGALARRAEAHGIRFVLRQRDDDAFGRTAGAVIGGLAFFFLRQLSFGVELRRRADARVGVAAREQFPHFVLVERKTLGLIKRTFVVAELEPLHRVKNGLNRFRRGALAVGVFDAKNKFAAVMTGKQKIEQRRARAADMQITGGAGSEAGSDLRHPGKLTGEGKSVNAALKCAWVVL